MNFARNILTDLWEKHLLPVAVALILAVVVIPLILSEDTSHRNTQLSPISTSSQKLPNPKQWIVTLKNQASLKHKNLDTFKQKNPFIQQARDTIQPASGSVTPTGNSTSGTTASAASSTSSGTTSSTTSSSSSTDTTSASSSDSATKLYQWAITVRFGTTSDTSISAKNQPQQRRLHKDLTVMTQLPSSKNPILTFLGISQNSRSAVFLIDRDVNQTGEGICRPSRTTCTFIYLKEDFDHNEHTLFRSTGSKYKITLKKIDIIPVSKKTLDKARS